MTASTFRLRLPSAFPRYAAARSLFTPSAVDRIEQIVGAHDISCNFRRLDAFLFPALGMDPKEAATEAAAAANVILALPAPTIRKAAQLASDIMKGLDF
jgi:hypothetical protein